MYHSSSNVMSMSAVSSLYQYNKDNNTRIDSQTLPHTPSDELSLTLAGITLNDDEENGQDDQVNNSVSMATLLEIVSSRLTQIKNQFFIIQEKRHAGVFALSEQTSSPSSKVDGDDVEKSVALDMAMAELNALLESASEGMKAADLHLNALKG